MNDRDRLRSVFKWMKYRCYDESCKQYKDYGGRGIVICDEWLSNFSSFYEWSIRNGYKFGLTIDRIDNDGIYEPSNCRWVDRFVQANNKRNAKSYYVRGVHGTMAELCRAFQKNYYRVRRRIHFGWNIEDALFEDKRQVGCRRTNRIVTVDGFTGSVSEMARKYGIDKTTVKGRLDRGWDVTKAFTTPTRKHERSCK